MEDTLANEEEVPREPELPTVCIQPARRERKLTRGETTTVTEVAVDGNSYAAKKIRHSVSARSNPEWILSLEMGLRLECRLLRQLTHPNIVMAIGLSFDDTANPARPTLVMELMEGGNLDDYIAARKGCGGMNELVQHAVLLDVARGLSYMHGKPEPLGPVVHWNLCSRKVFLTFQQPDMPVLAKIGGFGAASMECRRPHHIIADGESRKLSSQSTIAYAPEVFSGLVTQNATSVDVFSFGIVMLHTLTQELPLPLTNDLVMEVERRKQYLDKLDDNHPLKHIVMECLSNQPHYRPSVDDILSTIEKAELRTLIPTAEVQAMKQAHERALFRIRSEKDRLRGEKDRLSQRLDRLSEQCEMQIRELEQRVDQLQQQNTRLELRERERPPQVPHFLEQPRRPVERSQSETACNEVEDISRNEVQILEVIDRGAWATVAKGRYRRCLIAVKWPHDELLRNYPTIIPRLRREISIVAQLRHPNLVHFIGAVVDVAAQRLQERPFLLTELLDTNLRREYTRCQAENKAFGKHMLQSIFLDVAYGLHFLHTQHEPIIHRDISAPNVLLKRLPSARGCWLAKISDFGSANLACFAQTPAEGCIIYSAPEMFPQTDPSREQLPQTTKLDVYSYGILLCEVIAAELPLTGRYWSMLQTVGDKWSAMHDLIVQCTRTSPTARPTVAQVIDELNRIPRPALRVQSSCRF